MQKIWFINVLSCLNVIFLLLSGTFRDFGYRWLVGCDHERGSGGFRQRPHP